MLSAIIDFSINNKIIIGILTIALIIWGSVSVMNLPIDAVPDITNNQVQIITISPSLAAPEIERLVTFPIEQANANIPGMIEIRSFSRFGLSVVTIVFSDETDVYWARQQVSERLQAVRSQIPPDAGNPELGPVTTGLGEVYQYVVKAKPGYEQQYSPMELRTIQDWVVRRQLLGTPGVADVSSFGGLLKQYEVAVNPLILQSMGLTINDVFTALEENNHNTGGAYIEKNSTALFIRSEGLIRDTADIGNIVIKHLPGAMPILIGTVADVRIGNAVRYGAMCYNDEGEIAGAVVMMLKGENSSRVIQSVKKRIEEIQTMLPEGVIVEPFLDRTKMVNNAISTVETNLMEGALIVIFVLVLFLGNIRAGLVVASVIPLSMFIAVIFMNAFGVSGNLMSLGALDFGLIIDGAVIIVEAVLHRLIHNKHFSEGTLLTQGQMNDEVRGSARRMMSSAVFGQIIILIVYLPILTLEGIEGKMFTPMAQTVSFAIIGAFILSLTYVPMMSSLLLSRRIRHSITIADRMMTLFDKLYVPTLRKAMRYPLIISLASLGAFIVSVIILLSMGGEFIPELEEGDFAVDTRLMTGSSLTATIEATQKAAGLLKQRFPEVEKVVTKIGSGEIPTDPMPIEASDMMVILKDKKYWKSATNFDELANKMGNALSEIPGLSYGFQFPVQMRFNELMTGARQDVVCKIFGEDLDTLANYAEKLGVIIQTVQGAKDIYVEKVTGLPQIVITYNREAMARYGINIREANKIVRAGLAGESTGMVYEGERRFDLMVRIDSSKRTDITDIGNIPIMTASGVQIPLSHIAYVSIKDGVNQIQREDAKRRIIIGFNVRERDVQSLVEELRSKVNKSMTLPVGYKITYGGQFENLEKAKQRLLIAVPAALILILVMLYFAFRSLRYGFLIFTAIPLSAIGGIIALWSRGMPFSISAGVGFIALFGVAVLNGIVLMAEFARLQQTGLRNLPFIVMRGTRLRLRPVLMTAAVASLGFLPMALSNGAGAEVQRPLATVVIGGLITSTLLTLIVLPIMYIRMEKMIHSRHHHKKIHTISAIIILSIVSATPALTQPILTEEMALRMADTYNGELRQSAAYTAAAQALRGASLTIPKTDISMEYGNVNTFNTDTKISIEQRFAFPTFYSAQNKLATAHAESIAEQERLTKADIYKKVKMSLLMLSRLEQEKKLLYSMDTMLLRILTSAEQQLSVGDISMMEKNAVLLQKNSLYTQIQENRASIAFYKSELEVLIGSFDSFSVPPLTVRASMSDSTVFLHPFESVAQKEQEIASAQYSVETSLLLPDIRVGYINQSFVGWQSEGGAERFYNARQRFSSLTIGLSVPLFFTAQQAKRESVAIQQSAAELQLLHRTRIRRHALKQLSEKQRTLRSLIDEMENSALPAAQDMALRAHQAWNIGSLSLFEMAYIQQNAWEYQKKYIQNLAEYNAILIDIEFWNFSR